jgi:hypothetical protein
VTTPLPPASAFNDPFAAHEPVYAMATAAAAGSQTTVAVSAPQPSVNNLEQPVVEDALSGVAEVQSAGVVPYTAFAVPASIAWVETDVQPEVQMKLQTEVQLEIQTEVAPEASPTTSAISPEQEEIHRKAQRFARLLVEEIKLYNQDKVLEGRKNNDLCERLKDAIDKSRSTYQKRYGNTVAASGHYFEDEVKRSLAEDDQKSASSNFRM